MSSLYAILLFSTGIVPLVLSFDKKLQFYKQWKYLFPSIFYVSIFYIAVDILFTHFGIWGFNPDYYLGIKIAGLPIEEWLFFIIIPYACVFLHDSIALYYNNLQLTNRITRYISYGLIAMALAVIGINPYKIYTTYILSVTILMVLLLLNNKKRILNLFYISFIVIMIPFLIINGILTGTFIHKPVFWYNENEILGIRIVTIPIEDLIYAFTLIGFALFMREKVKDWFINKQI